MVRPVIRQDATSDDVANPTRPTRAIFELQFSNVKLNLTIIGLMHLKNIFQDSWLKLVIFSLRNSSAGWRTQTVLTSKITNFSQPLIKRVSSVKV